MANPRRAQGLLARGLGLAGLLALVLPAAAQAGSSSEDGPVRQAQEAMAGGQEQLPAPGARPGARGEEGPGRTLVTATRSSGGALETPWASEVVPAELIRRRSYRTLPQILRDVPGVMVQETSPGQGSPYLRGFTGFRTLLLIDGIRLNSSVLRDGPNQYWSTVDPWSLERLEVVMGPGSVLHGSDAIGGTVNAITKLPGYGRGFGGELFYRAATAEASHIGRLEVDVASGDRLGVLAGLGGKRFGDVEAGGGTGEQPGTGYDESSGDVKLESWLSDDVRLVVARQEVHQNDVPRTHSTRDAVPFEGTTAGSDRRRELDQDRELTYAQLLGTRPGEAIDAFRLSLSWHEQEELEDRIRSSGARSLQGFEVGTLGLLASASSPSAWGRWTYGFEIYRDTVDSFSTTNPIQGPVADDATYELYGVFVQDELDVTERLGLTLGARFEHAAADADRVSDPVTGQRIEIEDDWSELVGSARFAYGLVPERLGLFGGVSQGFRAPNLSDLTRFDSARSNELELPSPGLDPERFTSYELGLELEHERGSARLALFYTDIRDQIQRFPTGGTSPTGAIEITKDNVGDGEVHGVEVGGAWEVRPGWTALGAATWLDGEAETFPTSAQVLTSEPLDRLMPLTLQAGLRWEAEDGARWVELLGTWADDADELSTRDEADTQRIPPGGTPGYLVLDLRGGLRLREHVTLDLGLTNLTDEDYRVHGSGSNMPGRSLVAGVTVAF